MAEMLDHVRPGLPGGDAAYQGGTYAEPPADLGLSQFGSGNQVPDLANLKFGQFDLFRSVAQVNVQMCPLSTTQNAPDLALCDAVHPRQMSLAESGGGSLLQRHDLICTELGAGASLATLYQLRPPSREVLITPLHPPSFDRVLHVDLGRGSKDMLGIAAPLDVAPMADLVTGLQWPVSQDTDHDVSPLFPPAATLTRDGYLPIASAVNGSCPQPAGPEFGAVRRDWTVLINLRPQPISNAFCRSHSTPIIAEVSE